MQSSALDVDHFDVQKKTLIFPYLVGLKDSKLHSLEDNSTRIHIETIKVGLLYQKDTFRVKIVAVLLYFFV